MATDMRAKLTVEADAVGGDELRKMADELERMGGDGAQAAKRLRGLAGELDAIARESTQAERAVRGVGPAWQQAGEQAHSVSRELAVLRNAYIGLQAVMGAVQSARGLAATADQVSNLQARIKLVTGEGQLFGEMWDRVSQVALRTNSELGATGDLFARVAKAGKDAGLSAQQAAEQSLQITETINQTIQLSGASAEASSAAITQLIQGLQSGALRGDEFNSVMEQAPRLADALAAGMGVATGELRKMSEAGELTSARVIAALKGQADAIKQEFGSLPQTIGRSVENLATSWSLFIGETDKASGASAKVASAIDVLARNLDTVATVALRAGEVVAAMIAVKTIQSVYGYGTALLSASSATTALATSSTQAAGAISAAEAAKQRFANIARGIGYAAIADQVLQIALAYAELRKQQDLQSKAQAGTAEKEAAIVQRLQAISAATGVTVTSMQELDAAVARGALVFDEASAKWLSAAQAQEHVADAAGRSADALAGIEATKAVSEFMALEAAGKSTEEALKKLAEGLSVDSVQGAAGFARALEALRSTGTISAQQLGDAWQQALGKLSAGQIITLRDNLKSALDQGAISAQQWAQANEQILANSFKTLGVNAAQALGQVSEGAQEAINSIGLVADSAKVAGVGVEAAARAIEMSFMAAIPKADSLEAIAALEQKLQAMGQAGQISAQGMERVQAALDKQRATIEGQIPGIQSLEEALRELGVKPQAELAALADSAKRAFDAVRASGTATPREINEAWKAMAEAAIAANNGVAAESVKSQAAQHGFAIETDKAGKSIVKSMAEAEDATRKVGEQASQAGDKMAGMSAQAWDAGKDLVEQARRHNAALGAIQTSWLDAAAAASKYAEEAARLVFDSRKNIQAMRQEHAALVEQLEALGRQQRLLEDANGGAARGVEDLRLRLLELEGTEQQVAAARNERDKADLRSKMALARIELERATLANKQDEAQRLEREIALLGEQLALLGKVYAAEQKQRAAKARGDEGGSGGGGGGGVSAGPATMNVTLNANGISDPVKLARMIEPELARLGRLAR